MHTPHIQLLHIILLCLVNLRRKCLFIGYENDKLLNIRYFEAKKEVFFLFPNSDADVLV